MKTREGREDKGRASSRAGGRRVGSAWARGAPCVCECGRAAEKELRLARAQNAPQVRALAPRAL